MKTCNSCLSCGTVHVPVQAGEGEEPATRTVNVCRHNPPVSALFNSPNGPQALTLWPQIMPDQDYCSKHSVSPCDTCRED